MEHQQPPYPPLALALSVWGLAAALYLTGFFHRVAPAVITGELMTGFGLSAAALGNLSALYFYSYVPFQVPFGALADKFGPRRVLAAGAVLASVGAFAFAGAPTYALAGSGRFLIGAGVGVAFVCMLKLASHWFHPRYFAMLAGFSLLCGAVGAVSAGAPLRMLSDAYGWRLVIGSTGAFTLLLAVAIWIVVRDDPQEWRYATHSHPAPEGTLAHSLLGGIRESLRARNVRLIFFVSSGVSGAPLTFGGLWGVPFLTTHYGYSTTAAAALASLVLLCWALPSPLMGLVSDRLHRRKPIYVVSALIATAAWIVVIVVPELPRGVLVTLLVVAGCASAGVMVGFAYAKESAPAALAGTTTGIINTGNMLGGMLMQPAVGWILDRYWDGTLADGVRIYSFDAYRAGFTLMLGWLAVSLILVGFTHETNCRQLR
jgi:MFS family permease